MTPPRSGPSDSFCCAVVEHIQTIMLRPLAPVFRCWSWLGTSAYVNVQSDMPQHLRKRRCRRLSGSAVAASTSCCLTPVFLSRECKPHLCLYCWSHNDSRSAALRSSSHGPEGQHFSLAKWPDVMHPLTYPLLTFGRPITVCLSMSLEICSGQGSGGERYRYRSSNRPATTLESASRNVKPPASPYSPAWSLTIIRLTRPLF